MKRHLPRCLQNLLLTQPYLDAKNHLARTFELPFPRVIWEAEVERVRLKKNVKVAFISLWVPVNEEIKEDERVKKMLKMELVTMKHHMRRARYQTLRQWLKIIVSVRKKCVQLWQSEEIVTTPQRLTCQLGWGLFNHVNHWLKQH